MESQCIYIYRSIERENKRRISEQMESDCMSWSLVGMVHVFKKWWSDNKIEYKDKRDFFYDDGDRFCWNVFVYSMKALVSSVI